MKRTRWCMCTVATMSHPVYTDKATSLVKNFLEVTGKKWELRCAMVKSRDQIYFIKENCKIQLEQNRGKLVYLQLMWDKEIESMISALLKKNRGGAHTEKI